MISFIGSMDPMKTNHFGWWKKESERQTSKGPLSVNLLSAEPSSKFLSPHQQDSLYNFASHLDRFNSWCHKQATSTAVIILDSTVFLQKATVYQTHPNSHILCDIVFLNKNLNRFPSEKRKYWLWICCRRPRHRVACRVWRLISRRPNDNNLRVTRRLRKRLGRILYA